MQLTAIDTETTGLRSGYHEIIEISCITFDLETWTISSKLNLKMRPTHINRISSEALKINGFNLEKLSKFEHPNIARSAFNTWFENALEEEKINPLAHVWSFDKSFLNFWLGEEKFKCMFNYHYRDTQTLASSLQDVGKIPKNISTSLNSLTEYYDIPHSPHTANSDSNTVILLYKKLLSLMQ